MILKKFHALFLLFVLLAGCGTTKGLKKVKSVDNLSTKKIIQKHYAAEPNFNTLKARIKARYTGEKKSVSPSLSLRVQKDETIWISVKVLGIVMAKALITPNSVQYYENLSSTYFDGNFDLLSKWLGTELDFTKVQNLLLGQALYDLRKERFEHMVSNTDLMLTPATELELFKRMFTINGASFKVKSQTLSQTDKNQELRITYPEYQTIADQYFPKEIKIEAQKEGTITKMDLEYRDIELNSELSFPFKIPSGAKEITIK